MGCLLQAGKVQVVHEKFVFKEVRVALEHVTWRGHRGFEDKAVVDLFGHWEDELSNLQKSLGNNTSIISGGYLC